MHRKCCTQENCVDVFVSFFDFDSTVDEIYVYVPAFENHCAARMVYVSPVQDGCCGESYSGY
jgi:hypothetical protein